MAEATTLRQRLQPCVATCSLKSENIPLSILTMAILTMATATYSLKLENIPLPHHATSPYYIPLLHPLTCSLKSENIPLSHSLCSAATCSIHVGLQPGHVGLQPPPHRVAASTT